MKTNNEVVDSIYETGDYSKFKILEGNRDVLPSRVALIADSIDKVGFRNNPIIVNGKFEIIDGQGRFCALKEKGLPIRYIIDKTADIDICCALNINQKNWSTRDYIASYAKRGYEDYVRLSSFINAYPMFNLKTVCAVCEGLKSTTSALSKSASDDLKEGRFKFNGTDIDRSHEFEYLKGFVGPISRIGGAVDFYYSAILFAYRHTTVDRGRLLSKVNDLVGTMVKAPDMKTALAELTRVYNNSARANRVRIDFIYAEKDECTND